MGRYTRDELRRAAISFGAKDVSQVIEGIFAAGNFEPVMTIDDALTSLKRWQPNLFYGSAYARRILEAERAGAGEGSRGVRRRSG